jgi:hypothetical protein
VSKKVTQNSLPIEKQLFPVSFEGSPPARNLFYYASRASNKGTLLIIRDLALALLFAITFIQNDRPAENVVKKKMKVGVMRRIV